MRGLTRDNGIQDRLAAHPNAVGSHDDEPVQVMGVVGQDRGQASDDEVQWWRRTQPKKDHTDMRLVVDEYQSPKITIVGNQDASFAIGNAKNLRIRQSGWILSRNPGDIVSEGRQVRHEARIGALIQQEPHALL